MSGNDVQEESKEQETANPEEEVRAAPEQSSPEKSEEPSLESQLEKAKAKAGVYYDQLLREKADFENFRKRVDREKAELIRFGKSETFLSLLPLYDVLLHAHERIQAGEKGEALTDGLERIFQEFNKLFEKEGIVRMDAEGKAYDPNLHEVIGTVSNDDAEEDTVVEVLQRGFLVGDKVLRHARVRISKKSKQGE